MNKDALKKHHFWILAGVAPLFVVLAVLLDWNDVGAEVEKKQGEYKKAADSLKVNPKGTKILADLDEQKVTLEKKRAELWEDNWKRQANNEITKDADGKSVKLFDWPRNTRLAALEAQYPKFGVKIVDTDNTFEVLKKKEVYEAAYTAVAKSIAPTVFAGNSWRTVLRYVSDWTASTPSFQQVWLALEDFWVQRALLVPIRQVNEAAATFAPQDKGETPLKRTFASRVWKLELDASDRKFVRFKLTNTTDRLQLLGVGNTMKLRVWLSEAASARPIDLRIEGEFAKAGETLTVPKPVVALHGITVSPDEVKVIHRVEQVLDERTVPIRRVDQVVLGYRDNRNFATELKAPKFYPEDAATPAVPVGPPGGRPPVGGGDDGPVGPGGPRGPAGAAGARTGNPETVLDGNKKRYLAQNDQVRRMPVAIVLVVDQMFMQDAMVAYTNSPLRFQITQSHWKRFRGTLGGPAAPGGVPGGDDGDGPAPVPVPGGSPAIGSSGVGESQVSSGLVELTIYGVVSLYEKFDDKPAAAK